MTTKEDSIKRIKQILRENNLNHVFLNNAVYTHWQGDSDKQYKISELRWFDGGEIDARQGSGYKYQNTIQYLKDFDEATVLRVEKELMCTIPVLKKYRMKVESFFEIRVPRSSCVQEYVELFPGEVTWIEGASEIEEVE